MEDAKADVGKIIAELKETLDPEVCRCLVDAFLIRKKHLEVSNLTLTSHFA